MPENNRDLSLKDLVVKAKEWGYYLLSKWMLIFVVGIVGAGLGLIYALNKKPTYTGNLTFVLSNESKGSGGLASLIGQFGIDVNGGGYGAFEGENIIELLKSRRIIKGALLKYVPEQRDILINIIGKELSFFSSWRENKRVADQIPFSETNKLTALQDSLISVIHLSLIKNNLNISKVDKKLSFYKVSATSVNESVSINLTKNIVNEAAKMYIDTKTKTARENLVMLQHEADSLRGRLGTNIYASATQIEQTFNLNSALQTRRVPVQQNQVQIQVLGAAYGEVVKNLELAKMTLLKETPLYQIIDEPFTPLTVKKLGKLYALFAGGILASFICILILLGRRLLNRMMK